MVGPIGAQTDIQVGTLGLELSEMVRMTSTPDLMPVLSRGKHRNPKRGACFMEFASYLAGERWSDHPDCTHPLLAAVARDVNDYVDDAARARIAPMIPTVVGLVSDDPRADVWIAQTVALAALPIAPVPRQRVAAVGLIRCQEMLDELEGRPAGTLDPEVRAALDGQPQARDWAHRFARRSMSGGTRAFSRRSAPVIARASVAGVAEALLDGRDDRLIALLEQIVVLCQERFESEPVRNEFPTQAGKLSLNA